MTFVTSRSEDHFRQQYSMHDVAEEKLVAALESLELDYVQTGFDPESDGTRETGHRRSDRTQDLLVEGLQVDVKTKKKRKHVGNIPERKWEEYPGHTWFAWFHVHEGSVVDSWSYRKKDAEVVDIEDSPWGDERWVVISEDSLRPLEALLLDACEVHELLN